MLERSGSDAGPKTYTRLHRSRSVVSVQERRRNPIVLEPLDPDTAHVHALVAAHRAMERSTGRTSSDLRRSGSSASKNNPRRAMTDRVPWSEARYNRSTYQTSRDLHQQDIHVSSSEQRTIRRTQSSLAPEAPHPPSEVSDTFVEQYTWSPMRGREIEQRIPSENYGAQPSSFRRLRKARSLLTPQKKTINLSDLRHQIQSFSPAKSLRGVQSAVGLRNPTDTKDFVPQVRRSPSFIRFSRRAKSHADFREQDQPRYSEEAVRLAREKFLKGHNSHMPQYGFRTAKSPRHSLPGKSFSRLRIPVKSDNQEPPRKTSGSKFRNFSASIRDRVRTILSKSTNARAVMPAQQLPASRRHFGEPSDVDSQGFDAYACEDAEVDRRNSLYIPSSAEADELEATDKVSSSLRQVSGGASLHSGARSRITSWTNSTVTGAGSLHAGSIQQNRLSIIKEDGGPHQPSSSAGRHIGGVAVFQEPIEASAIDSQRIYSALMKRIDQEQAEMNQTEHQLNEIHGEQQSSNQTNWTDTGTIRAVLSEASVRTVHHAPDPEYRQFSIAQHKLGAENPKYHFSHNDGHSTSQNVKSTNSKQRANLASQSAQSSFYPYSEAESKPPGPSPFKQVLMQKRQDQNKFASDSEEDASDNSPLAPFKRPTTRGKSGRSSTNNQIALHRSKLMSDESVYSRTTGGDKNESYQTPLASTEDFRLPHISEHDDIDDKLAQVPGMATIIPTRIKRYPRASERVGKLVGRQNSSASTVTNESRDWRGWMEKQLDDVSDIDYQLERQQSRASERSGHVREHAQIDGDDVEVGGEHNGLDKVQRRFPLLDLKQVSRGNTPTPRRLGSNRGLVKSQSGFVSKTSSDENKMTAGFRKISPSVVAQKLKAKGSSLRAATTKENKVPKAYVQDDMNDAGAREGSDSPPASTPGKLMMAYAKHGSGRLRSKKSDQLLTPKHVGKKRLGSAESPALSSNNGTQSDGSGSSGRKFLKGVNFSARLSRPFDMDCPDHNRPFHSMYLGKGPTVVSSTLVGPGKVPGNRLSVAPPGNLTNVTKSENGYGGLGAVTETPSSLGPNTEELTPTPEEVRGLSAKMSSKRLVSDFPEKTHRTIRGKWKRRW